MLSIRKPPQEKRCTLNSRGGKIFHANRNEQKTGVEILISDKIVFKTKAKRQRRSLHNT